MVSVYGVTPLVLQAFSTDPEPTVNPVDGKPIPNGTILLVVGGSGGTVAKVYDADNAVWKVM